MADSRSCIHAALGVVEFEQLCHYRSTSYRNVLLAWDFILSWTPGGGVLSFNFCYVALDPASTVYPPNIRNVRHPKIMFKISVTQKNIYFCSLTLRKKNPSKMHRNGLQNSPGLSWTHLGSTFFSSDYLWVVSPFLCFITVCLFD